MDRQIFSKVVRSVAFEKRQRYLEFLKHCELLRNVHDKEMLDVADALKCEEYKRGDTIIREGDAADASKRRLTSCLRVPRPCLDSVLHPIGQRGNSHSATADEEGLCRREDMPDGRLFRRTRAALQ